MEFHLKINCRSLNLFSEEVFNVANEGDSSWVENRLMLVGADAHTRIITIVSPTKTGWIIGDPILEKDKKEAIEKYLESSDYTNLLQSLNGHYRIVVFDRKNFTICVSSSLFGILPLYYYRAGDIIYVSTKSKLLSGAVGQNSVNKRFILENVLFYYQLFNETAYQGIKRLPAHHVLEISGKGMRFTKHSNISDWFVENPKPWHKSTGEMTELFIDRVKYYLPDEPYIHSLTGGFDGRCLVACGLYHQKNFETYGFGNGLSDDTRIASHLASKAGLKFNLIKLDREYVTNHSLRDGLQFITHSEGNAGFARAHYLYSSKLLSKRAKYLVTGNFGSEIFRAAHNAGAVISDNLYHLYNSSSVDEALEKIERSPEFQWINRMEMTREWNELKSDISGLPVFNRVYSGMSQNEKFYLFVFEEVFRKYFGAEMVNQYHYLNNRSPFLDIQFLKGILKTGLAGVYSDFFENNPLKRFKGQVLYAHFIRKTYPSFNDILTDKGYRPKDLLSLMGKLYITNNFLKKKLRGPGPEIDPNSVSGAFAYNRISYREQPIDPAFFNVNRFKNSFDSNLNTHDFLIAVSQLCFLNSLSGHRKSKTNALFLN